ncbi:DNA sulfur modification protein DndD, partial [Erwinia amylovora]|nr:DNA sulfur modification protein DndD [Erwinia amylovora]
AKSFVKELSQFLTLLGNDIALRSSTTSKIATVAITDNLKVYMANKPKGDLLFDIAEREAGMLQLSIGQESKRAWHHFDLYRNQLAEVELQLEQAAANIA